MNSNDCLLTKMIELDMKHKAADCYYMIDTVEHNPSFIEVKTNEVVYVHFFKSELSLSAFDVQLKSNSGTSTYTPQTTTQGISNHITRHFGGITISGELPANFYLHYVRVKF